ncbi:MAG TPA: energy transducer TonB [Candidatus Alistipes avicola]|uniref:Energy transducer TonB n=1 Tax=Candidatus Alistipes avicola TaxID=2838432 RepID=A0A9D2IDW8_9BACT|nr:energy transducer TonB [uncultured Alistipes sp.]HJA98806.1 energy transducer TonB [Candidatus Alistipes avicola]
MEIKKSRKADLENRRGIFLEIGLVIALAIVIGAFGCKSKERNVEKVDMVLAPIETDLVEITRPDQPQEQPQVKKVEMNVISDVFQLVDNSTKTNTELNFIEFDADMSISVAPPKEEEIVEEPIFVVAEKMPSFMGGDLTTFRTWVQQRLKYPAIAQEYGISGQVILEFVVEKDGTLSNIVVLRTPDNSLSEEAIRVLKTSPKWEPGLQRNKPVRVKYTLPVIFRIAE